MKTRSKYLSGLGVVCLLFFILMLIPVIFDGMWLTTSGVFLTLGLAFSGLVMIVLGTR